MKSIGTKPVTFNIDGQDITVQIKLPSILSGFKQNKKPSEAFISNQTIEGLDLYQLVRTILIKLPPKSYIIFNKVHLINCFNSRPLPLRKMQFKDSSFENCHMNNIEFTHCKWVNSSIIESNMLNCLFEWNDFDHCMFRDNKIRMCTISEFSLYDSKFELNRIKDCDFNLSSKGSQLTNNQFIESDIDKFYVEGSDIDTILFDSCNFGPINVQDSITKNLQVTGDTDATNGINWDEFSIALMSQQ